MYKLRFLFKDCKCTYQSTGGGLQILTPWGTAIFIDSLPIKSRKRFAHNGMYTSATQASLVHGITATDWKTQNGSLRSQQCFHYFQTDFKPTIPKLDLKNCCKNIFPSSFSDRVLWCLGGFFCLWCFFAQGPPLTVKKKRKKRFTSVKARGNLFSVNSYLQISHRVNLLVPSHRSRQVRCRRPTEPEQ